jgi:hypothetical protein
MTEIYEAELKFLAEKPYGAEDLQNIFEGVFSNIQVVSTPHADSQRSVTDLYMFDKNLENHVRIRNFAGKIEYTSKRISSVSKHVRIEPEITFSSSEPVDPLALFRNMGFRTGLVVEKSNVNVLTGKHMDGMQYHLSSYTAHGYRERLFVAKKHFVEVELDKGCIPSNWSIEEAGNAIEKTLKSLNESPEFKSSNLILTTELIPTIFTGYKPQLY